MGVGCIVAAGTWSADNESLRPAGPGLQIKGRMTTRTHLRLATAVLALFIVPALPGTVAAERTMRHRRSTATAPPQGTGNKTEPGYPGMGGGHFVKSVREEGRFVTLEDNSVWEIEQTDRYLTMHWEVEAGISIRSSGGDDGYVYEIDNVDKDEGASARWLRPQPGKA
jgi:hypothetical protein